LYEEAGRGRKEREGRREKQGKVERDRREGSSLDVAVVERKGEERRVEAMQGETAVIDPRSRYKTRHTIETKQNKREHSGRVDETEHFQTHIKDIKAIPLYYLSDSASLLTASSLLAFSSSSAATCISNLFDRALLLSY
jgi:hypothetical protein